MGVGYCIGLVVCGVGVGVGGVGVGGVGVGVASTFLFFCLVDTLLVVGVGVSAVRR